MEKKEIRKAILQKRGQLTSQMQSELSHQIIQKICMESAYQKYQTIYAYRAFRQEVLLDELFELAKQEGKRLAFPKVEGTEMSFYYVDSSQQFVSGAYGILEPLTDDPADDKQALMLMPGVAFTKDCCRLGYGGGFYDKFIEKHPDFYTIACAFELQIVADIPQNKYDCKPQIVLTERNRYERIRA